MKSSTKKALQALKYLKQKKKEKKDKWYDITNPKKHPRSSLDVLI